MMKQHIQSITSSIASLLARRLEYVNLFGLRLADAYNTDSHRPLLLTFKVQTSYSTCSPSDCIAFADELCVRPLFWYKRPLSGKRKSQPSVVTLATAKFLDEKILSLEKTLMDIGE
jgi:hypothetical protein